MTKQTVIKHEAPIKSLILGIRGRKVILDSDLASIYGVETKRLNEAVKRNADRFPKDFAFRLTLQEAVALKSQPAKSNSIMRSQFATASKRNIRFLPLAFTEHGAIMAASRRLKADGYLRVLTGFMPRKPRFVRGVKRHVSEKNN